jgi:hypothetical protein
MKAAANRSSARSDATTTVTVGDRIFVAGTQSTSSSDPLEVFRQAALTFQTPPAIYQRQRLGLEDLPKVWLRQDGSAPSSGAFAHLAHICWQAAQEHGRAMTVARDKFLLWKR